MDYQFDAWYQTKPYRCRPCKNEAMKLDDYDSDRICRSCGKPVEIKMTHARAPDRFANYVKAKDLMVDDQLAIEIAGSFFTWVLVSEPVQGKSNLWQLALKKIGRPKVDPNKPYYRFLDVYE